MEYIRDTERRNRVRYALFKCPYCGKIVERRFYNGLKQKSCGCRKYRFKHKETGTRLYRIWANIKQRCNNPGCPDYKYYGAKGVKMCKEWELSYETFRDWALANGYREDLTIDRINNSKGYYPDNCRWIPASENTRISSSSRSRPWAKFSPDEIRKIRNLAKEISQYKIAKIFNVSPKIIWKIVHRKTYRWVK